jgi:hypothetical protein
VPVKPPKRSCWRKFAGVSHAATHRRDPGDNRRFQAGLSSHPVTSDFEADKTRLEISTGRSFFLGSPKSPRVQHGSRPEHRPPIARCRLCAVNSRSPDRLYRSPTAAVSARSRGMVVLDLGMPAEEIEKAGIGANGLEAVRDQHRASVAAAPRLRAHFSALFRVAQG